MNKLYLATRISIFIIFFLCYFDKNCYVIRSSNVSDLMPNSDDFKGEIGVLGLFMKAAVTALRQLAFGLEFQIFLFSFFLSFFLVFAFTCHLLSRTPSPQRTSTSSIMRGPYFMDIKREKKKRKLSNRTITSKGRKRGN